MKYLFYIFSFLILFKPVFPFVEYIANYSYISTVLCENKDKPKLNCNGKCYLMKQLAKNAESKGKETKPEKNNKVEIPFVFIIDKRNDIGIGKDVWKIKNHVLYQNLYQENICFKILKPPQYSVIF